MINLSTDQTTASPTDPLATYAALCTEFGRERAFLMESLGGPESDNRFSMTGVAGRAEVMVHDAVVTFSGADEVTEHFRDALVTAGVVEPHGDDLVLTSTEAFWELPRALSASFVPPARDGGLSTSFLTFYGYDAARYVEDLPLSIDHPAPAPPDVVHSLVDVLVTHREDSTEVSLLNAAGWVTPETAQVQGCLVPIADHVDEQGAPEVPEPLSITDDISRDDYLAKGLECLEHIRIGNIYQVQLGHAITVETAADPLDVYRRLRRRNPSPYMALMHVAGATIVCASPELFIRTDGTAAMRPIAGTAARGGDEQASVARLLEDPKERAEHLMLVDLCRNDLGRIAAPGSVDTPALMEVEAYSHVFHLVSEVTCKVDEPYDVYDAVRATFPAGTMSGAPKVRAMEIIESLETSRRGFYAGAFGLVSLNRRDSVLGLAIRMAVHRDQQYVLRASAGFVADSTPEAEWQETLNKLASTYWAVCGKEIR